MKSLLNLRKAKATFMLFILPMLIFLAGKAEAQNSGNPVISAQISTGTISSANFCPGAPIAIPFTVSGTFNNGNTFTAQLSDSLGNFQSPISLGSVTDTTSDTIFTVIPVNISAGSGYRVRVVASEPIVTGTDNGSDISINPLTAIATPSQIVLGGSSTLSVAHPHNGVVYSWTGQGLAASAGSAVVATPTSTGTKVYSVSVSGNTCSGIATTQLIVVARSLTTGNISSPLCPGSVVQVPYTAAGVYSTSNVFTAQLSDANGLFNSPVNLGSTSSTVSGSITAFLPPNLSAGSGYRIRVISSGPYFVGTTNQTDLSVPAIPTLSINATPRELVLGNTITLTAGSSFPVSSFAWLGQGMVQDSGYSVTAVPANSGAVKYKVSAVTNGCKITAKVNVLVRPDNSQDWVVIDNGSEHTLAIKSDGTLWAWGSNANGRLGIGGFSNSNNPVQVGFDHDWISVSAGTSHSLAIKSDGTLWGWGRNNSGQVGDGSTLARTLPVQIGSANNWESVSAGDDHSAGLKTDGSLWVWGSNAYGQLGDGTTTTRFSPVQVPTANWENVSANFMFTVGVKTDGTLWAWGKNGLNQLGDGTISNRRLPVRIGNSSDWVTATGGVAHGLALKADSSIWTWGRNTSGELGIGNTNNQIAPVMVGTAKNWVAVSAGSYHNIAITTDGTIWAWGLNTNGQLGDNTSTNSLVPKHISGQTGVVAISAGSKHSTILKASARELICATGNNGAGQLGNNSLTQSLSYGCAANSGNYTSTNTIAILAYCPQSNILVPYTASGSFNNNNVFRAQLSDANGSFAWPLNIGGNSGKVSGTILARLPFTIQAGTNYRIRVISTSSLEIGPDNGQDITIYPWPVVSAVASPASLTIGSSTTLEVPVQQASTTYTWVGPGLSTTGGASVTATPMGTGVSRYRVTATANGCSTTARVKVTAIPGTTPMWVEISNGKEYSLALKSDGTLWGWGKSETGRLGIPDSASSLLPVKIDSSAWKSISAGYFHSLGVKADGTLWAWGRNNAGQLGTGTLVSSSIPVKVGTDTDWVSVSAGKHHSMALKADGALWTWGLNADGQLGIGTTINSLAPVQVMPQISWQSISAGNCHSVAIAANGSLWAWGDNKYGQVGNGNYYYYELPADALVPVNISNSGWEIVAAGDLHTVALDYNGIVWAWGRNKFQQIGNNSFDIVRHPTSIGGTDWAGVGAGSNFGLAYKNDGSLWVWGQNSFGQLGKGDTLLYGSPTKVLDQANVVRADGGMYHSGILKQGQDFICMTGYNATGELGDATTSNRRTFGCFVGVSTALPRIQTEVTTQITSKSSLEALVYPNPFDYELNIELTSPVEGNVHIELVDMMGRQVFAHSLAGSASSYTIRPNRSLSAGVYLLLINNGGNISQYKVVKK